MTKKRADIVGYDVCGHWLVLIETLMSAGLLDGKRREERKELFAGSTAGVVFVTAFSSRDTMRSFLPHISSETEVWIGEAPNRLSHFNGKRFLGPYPDVILCRTIPQ